MSHTVARTSLKSMTVEQQRVHHTQMQANRRRREKMARLAAVEEARKEQVNRLATLYMVRKQEEAVQLNEAHVLHHMNTVLTDPTTGGAELSTMLATSLREVTDDTVAEVHYALQPPTPERRAPQSATVETSERAEGEDTVVIHNYAAQVEGEESEEVVVHDYEARGDSGEELDTYEESGMAVDDAAGRSQDILSEDALRSLPQF
jgi:hypothetical protein